MTGRGLVVEADGGSRGNPGPAGYGAVVRDARTGEVLAERRGAIGQATNNVAEYHGLIEGLRAAAEIGADEVEVRLDSRLLVEQMSGRWQVKNARLASLAEQAAGLVGRLGSVRFAWVPRSQNAHADRLANAAMDSAEAVAAPRQPTPQRGRPTGWSDDHGQSTATFLVRHGETQLSVERRFSGRGDVGLTAVGRTQAQLLAGRFAAVSTVDAVVSSPLRRARQTAEVLAAAVGRPVVEERELMETDFGEWEGLTFAEVRQQWPTELTAWLASADVAPPGGESFAETAVRVRGARDRLLRDHRAEEIVVISHVTPIKTLLRFALDTPAHSLYRMHLDPAGVSEVDWHADGQAVVRLMNDTSHLRP